MTQRTFTTDRVPLPPGFRMFILPEYRLVTPSYSVRFSPSQGTILAVLLANYERYVPRSHIEASLWGHLEDGGPESACNTMSVMLSHIRTKFRLVGIDVTVKGNWWHKQDRALRAYGLGECDPVGCPNNPVRLKALWDRQSPNPSRGLPDIKQAPKTPPKQTPKIAPTQTQKERRRDPLRAGPRYSYVERPRPLGSWTHNARAEAFFGERGPK